MVKLKKNKSMILLSSHSSTLSFLIFVVMSESLTHFDDIIQYLKTEFTFIYIIYNMYIYYIYITGN